MPTPVKVNSLLNNNTIENVRTKQPQPKAPAVIATPEKEEEEEEREGKKKLQNELFQTSKAKTDFTTSSYRNKTSALLGSTFLFLIPSMCVCCVYVRYVRVECLCGIVSKTYSIHSNYSVHK